jgi:hypothetical protein
VTEACGFNVLKLGNQVVDCPFVIVEIGAPVPSLLTGRQGHPAAVCKHEISSPIPAFVAGFRLACRTLERQGLVGFSLTVHARTSNEWADHSQPVLNWQTKNVVKLGATGNR